MDNFKVALLLNHSSTDIVSGNTFPQFINNVVKSPEQRQAERIVKEEDGRAMTIAFRALEFIGEPKTLSDLFLAFEFLPFTGASGSKTTIRYTNMWIHKEYIDDSQCPRFRPVVNDIHSYCAYRFSQLGTAYERIYDLENAVICHKQAVSLHSLDGGVCCVSDVIRCLNRLGEFEESIAYLKNIKGTPNYTEKYIVDSYGDKQKNHWILTVDECLADTLKKKEKKYVYRPRPQSPSPEFKNRFRYCD